MKKGNSDPLPPDLAAELATLEAMPDDTIDTSDIPEVRDWSGAVRGQFYKPRKLQKTLRIDADVLAWFEAQGPGHLTRMNQALRAAMLREIRRKKKGEAA
nr:BrnA antitoxin family protein [uncultured Rhodopila sp.]